MTTKTKTRHLSIYQYFEMLQLEWLIADLRQRIAQRSKDKDYWKRVKEGKRLNIEAIAERNCLPTIFTDSDLRSDIERRIFDNKNFPNFHYKDESDKQLQGYWDMLHYYRKGAEVRFERFGEVKVGVIESYRVNESVIKIRIGEEVIDLCVKEVFRIL